MFVAHWRLEDMFSKFNIPIVGWALFIIGGIGSLVVNYARREYRRVPEQSTKPGGIDSRKMFFGYFNPRDWGFSMFRFGHMIRNIRSYAEYALHHKASRPSPEELDTYLPEARNSQLTQMKNTPSKGIQILWIGHASVLVQIDGVNILFDPVFHDCGPCLCGRLISGYRRFRGPAVTVGDLKRERIDIHAVCISHNHYDHLDIRSVEELVAAYDQIQWFVPKGMQRWFQNRECRKVEDHDWWDPWEGQLGNGTDSSSSVTFTPAKHYSLRGILDYYCRHLWGGWFVTGPMGSKFFFSGDTGYVDGVFNAVREHCGSPDVTAIPIGAYKPRPVMEAQHIDPEEALKIHRELGATHSIGIHWGTFALSNERIHEPKEDLESAIKKFEDELEDGSTEKTNLRNFIVLNHGEVRRFPLTDSEHSE